MDRSVDQVYFARVMASALYANSVMSMAVIGLHLFMSLYGLIVFLETPQSRRKGRRRYVFISFVITGLSTFSYSLDAAWIFKCLFDATSPLGVLENIVKYEHLWGRTASLACLTTVIFIGDALLVYRCFVIWRHRWYLIVIPVMTYLASVGIGLLVLVPASIGTILQARKAHLAAWIYLNVATNVMVTGLIASRLFFARRNASQFLSATDLGYYNGIIAMLIESALPLSLAGIVFAALLVVAPEPSTGATVDYQVAYWTFSFLYYVLTGLAPHMIIYRITTNRSWVRRPLHAGSTGAAMSQPLKFESPSDISVGSTVDEIRRKDAEKDNV